VSVSQRWQLPPSELPPDEFVAAVRECAPQAGARTAQLLWQRGLRDRHRVAGFLDPARYQPSPPSALDPEMARAVRRIGQAHAAGERVAIWGDFDADGLTATSVLWEGLGQWFAPHQQLRYTIPNRLSESHGLNRAGIAALAQWGATLLVTCDTGSSDSESLAYAQSLGLDAIVTDHHTLPEQRPPATAIVNPRYLPQAHPLQPLSGVAVAYKLMEALYAQPPTPPQQSLQSLLDLVAVGLIADLVELRDDARYLAQQGIRQLQHQAQQGSRPGIARLLRLCQRHGDRPTDIAFGLGPRINAASRVLGDASFCIELLTGREPQSCHALAERADLANTRRKELQRTIASDVRRKLAHCDLSTTAAIVLEDPQWASGLLGLVAGQIAEEFGRPTLLLTTGDGLQGDQGDPLARGSARSVGGLDLYQLVREQSHLLHRFGGHPLAAGLSLPARNVPLLAQALDRQLRQHWQRSTGELAPRLAIDLTVTADALGQALFGELKLLEPFGMGNPAPKLLVRDCWFAQLHQHNLKDAANQPVRYIRTTFRLCDRSAPQGVPGAWWGHYRHELPASDRCDAVVELAYNAAQKRYDVRLLAVRASTADSAPAQGQGRGWLWDWREGTERCQAGIEPLILRTCPASWAALQVQLRAAIAQQRPLALAYGPPHEAAPERVWQQLLGIARYLARTGEAVARSRLCQRLELEEGGLDLGLAALRELGATLEASDRSLSVRQLPSPTAPADGCVAAFQQAVAETRFRQQYFCQAPLASLQAALGLD